MKLARAAHITAVLVEEGLGYLTSEGEGEDRKDDLGSTSEVARRLRRTLERLGPTFVKFGQLLATRVDLFDEDFIIELAELHAHVAPFPTEQARAVVVAALDRPLEEVFSDFSEEPVAAASIAQVHSATLRSTGERVALKIQRPGLDQSLLADLDALLVLSGFIDRLVPPYRRSMVHAIAEEYALRARGETDFVAEARAIEQFAEVLTTLPEFRVPKVHAGLCTPRLLVMEWIDGTKLGDVRTPAELATLGFEPERFGRAMLKLQLSMAYEHGFVHGDTHPGNIILEPSGSIALIDFGLHAHVPRALRDKMLEVVFNQASGRTHDAVQAFVAVFQPDPSADLEAFKAELEKVMDQSEQQGGIAQHRITEQLVRGMRVGARHHLKTQSDLFTVIRNLTIVEGIVLRFCPELDPVAEVRDITGAILRRRLFGPSMRKDFEQILPMLMLTISQRPQLAARLMKLERSFHEADTLGEFLRKEDVIARHPPPDRAGPLTIALVALVFLAVGLGTGLLLGR